MTVRTGIFAGACPSTLASTWLGEAEKTEINDPNAIALATVDAQGMPNARVVLLKAIRDDGFVFYTNYNSIKSQEVEQAQKAAFVMHWKSLRRQIRVRGKVTRQTKAASDQYYQTRGLQSRLGAWASQQSKPLASREALMQEVERFADVYGDSPPRPDHWGGYHIAPDEIEFWADGAARLHDRFRWTRKADRRQWSITRLNP